MLTIKVAAYGIAREILNARQLDLELSPPVSVGGVRQHLIETYPAFAQLASLRFAVNEAYQEDSFILSHQDEVVIIPPVSGG